MSYTVLINRNTGKVLYLDTFKMRYDRLRGRVRDWADLVGNDGLLYMYTLTYDTKGTLGDACTWQPNHIRDFMLQLRKVLGSDLIGYAWVAELTRSGVLHYHVLVRVIEGTRLPYPDRDGLWLWGLTRLEQARTPWYIVKYVGKEYQKDFSRYPKGARLFGVWIAGEKQKELRYRNLKPWQKEVVDNFGWDALAEYRKPDTGYLYVGSCSTSGYAEFLGESAFKDKFSWVYDELGDDSDGYWKLPPKLSS